MDSTSIVIVLVQKAQDQGEHFLDKLPEVARTPAQAKLEAKYGTPREFAIAAMKCIFDMPITHREVNASIKKYLDEWNLAGEP